MPRKGDTLTEEHKAALRAGHERARLSREEKRRINQARWANRQRGMEMTMVRGVDYEPPETTREPDYEPAGPIASAYEQKPAAPGVDYDSAMEGRTANAGFAHELAAAISSLVQQGQTTTFGPKPVPPALLQKRARAREKMIDMLEDMQEKNELPPRYEIITPPPGGFFCDDVMIPTGEQIDYFGIPNEGMVPMNGTATKIMGLFLESIGGGTPDLADQSYEAYLNRPRHAAVVGERHVPPPLGTPRTLQSAKVAVVETVERRYAGAGKVLGTVQSEIPGRF